MKRFCILLFVVLKFNTIWSNTHPIDSILNEVSKNNIALQALKKSNEADIAALKAANKLGATSVDYSPFYAKNIEGIASSEFIIKQEFDFPTLYAARNEATELGSQTKDMEFQSLRQTILLEAMNLCMELIHLNKLISIVEERYHTAKKMLELYETKMAEGSATALEVNRIKMEMMKASAETEQFKSKQKNHLHTLRALNGDKPIDIKCATYPQWNYLPNDSTFIGTYMTNDAELKSLQAQAIGRKQNIAIRKQEKLPKISIGYRRNTSVENASNGFLIGAAIPLFTGRQKIKEAKARYESMQLEVEEAQTKKQNELRNIMNEATYTKRAIDAYDQEIIKTSIKNLQTAIENDNITAIEYFREKDLINENLQNLLTLENKYYKLLAQMQKYKL